MSRKVTINLTVELTFMIDEGEELQHVIHELDYNFIDNTGKADIVNAYFMDYEIVDSR